METTHRTMNNGNKLQDQHVQRQLYMDATYFHYCDNGMKKEHAAMKVKRLFDG